MQIITLYRYNIDDGGITVSPIKSDHELYTTMFRIVADEGKLIALDGENTTSCTDAESADGWYEVEDRETADDAQSALDILFGGERMSLVNQARRVRVAIEDAAVSLSTAPEVFPRLSGWWNRVLYKSLIESNVWTPDENKDAWEIA